jgi:hypothetical protein
MGNRSRVQRFPAVAGFRVGMGHPQAGGYDPDLIIIGTLSGHYSHLDACF